MQWLTKEEAMAALGITSTHSLDTLVRLGRLPAYRLTRRLLFRPEDVERVIAESRVGVTDLAG